MSFTKEQVPARRPEAALGRRARTWRRAGASCANYNCQGCHQIGAKGGTIRAVIEDQLESSGGDVLQAQALSPPMLYNEKSKIGEGARVHTDWLHGFLADPSNHIRPWLQLRMPTFEFTEEQLNTITRYFAAQDRVPYPYEPKPAVDARRWWRRARTSSSKWQCVKCHVVAGKLPNQDPANMAPDLANVPRRLRADWLVAVARRSRAHPARHAHARELPRGLRRRTPIPEILGGDQKKQIEAVRAYLLTLGKGGATASTRSAGMD